MKFVSLYLHNFLTIGAASLNLKDKGLHLIQGINDDNSSAKSNGSGKSSIVDGICWCLFGVTARGSKGDKVVNRERKKDCMVFVTIEHGSQTFKVERYRKHGTFKNGLKLWLIPDPTGPSTDLTKGTDAETQKEVERILGCSYEVFKAAVYAGQEQMPDLPMKTDKELKMLVEEAAGMERIEAAYGVARERLNTAKSNAVMCQNRSDDTATQIARIESSLDIQRTERDAWEVGRTERVAQAKNRVDSASSLLRATIAELTAAKPDYEAAKVRIDEIETVLADATRLAGVAAAEEARFHKALAALNRAHLDAANATVANIKAAIAGGGKDIVGSPCDECGKLHTEEDADKFVEHQKARLPAAEQKAAEEAAKLTAAAYDAALLKKAAVAARAAVPDTSAISTERAAVWQKVRTYDDKKATADRLALDRKAAIEALALRESEANPKASAVKLLEDQLADETGKLAAHREAVDKAIEKLEIAEAVVKVFGPAGVRAQILDTVTPFLNTRTNDYLNLLTDGHTQATWTTLTKAASGDLKEKFSIEVTDDQGADDFIGLSGGEKKKVRISTALALQDLVASRATQPIDLWIGDEIDEALDSSGLERLMAILERKARERGTVLVISHNELRDWCDEVTVVRKVGKISTVEGSLCV